ncbi:mitochondrial ribosomal protein L37-domain-containing protein [Naematelia encephala]|uniref:Large ribosomal subunit protein mL54 n=1 Tax=Naematelia encephala TaxID=71784 RepID=A0A1Y2B6K1_9TREE|nr:mitochondrial ribosomal protein L37-domain-containing protein [Naematelia encephala]
MTLARIAQRAAASSSRAAARPIIANFSSSSSFLAESSASSSSVAPTAASGSRSLKKKKTVISECAPGTVLSGLTIYKNKPDPIAKADEEYPDWLWTLLDEEKASVLASQPKQEVKPGQAMNFEAERKRLRALNKARIKAANFIKST